MKLFGARDELFEIMAQAAARNRGGSSGGSHSHPVVGTTATPTPVAPPSSRSARPSATTSAALARAGITAVPQGSAALGRSDLVEVDGEALIVIDDEAEVAPPPPRTEDGVRLFSLRMDTVVVGGVLVAGLLLGSFLLGRTSAGGSPETGSNEVAVGTPPDVESNPQVGVTPSSTGNTTLPAGAPREARGTQPQTQAQPQPQPQTQAQQAQPQAETAPPAKPTHAIQVCHTTPEKAQALAKWLNDDPRSPIFGRGDLEATVKGGSVRITGFTRQDTEVLARVQATSDPTGGSGTFGSAYYMVVR